MDGGNPSWTTEKLTMGGLQVSVSLALTSLEALLRGTLRCWSLGVLGSGSEREQCPPETLACSLPSRNSSVTRPKSRHIWQREENLSTEQQNGPEWLPLATATSPRSHCPRRDTSCSLPGPLGIPHSDRQLMRGHGLCCQCST